MKESTSKTNYVLFIAVLVLIGICAASLSVTKINATSPEQTIASTLEQLNASDAVYVEAVEGVDDVLLKYYSSSTGYNYSFRKSTGVLWSIDSIGSDKNQSSSSTYSTPLSDAKRRDVVMDFASFVFSNSLIGQLEITKVHDAGYAYKYTIKEYYDEMETGTVALITCYENGRISLCSVSFGSIFTRNKDGSISLRDDSPFIGEEAAIEIALDFVEPHATERGNTLLPETATTAIRASENLQYYEVCVDTEQPDGYVIEYIVCVDVHSGEITFWAFDQ